MLTLLMMLMMAATADDPPITMSRTEQLRLIREQKARNLEKPQRSALESGLIRFKDYRVLERIEEGIHGFHPIVGGMETGSGFALGTWFEKSGIRTSAQVSANGSHKFVVGLNLPKLNQGMFADFRATYRNFLGQDFYGQGANSKKEDQVEYSLEDIDYTGRFGFKPARLLKAGVDAGWSSIGVAFDGQPCAACESHPRLNLLKFGAFIEADHRDQAGNPRSGGFYSASWSQYHDRILGRYSFGRYAIEAQHYLPFFNQRRVIALRVKTTLTRTAPGQQIPFHMQPSLGGSQDLRGFREFRYRDNNMVVLNAEYRWEAFSGLDLALFADAGQVAPRPTDIDFTDLKKSYGFGFRFNSAKSVFLRTDFGFSGDGRRIFVKFGHVF